MNVRILIIEDDLELSQILSNRLQELGYIVDQAETQARALQLAEEKDPDLYLLDVALPDGNGFALCRLLRQYSVKPILFLTAQNEEDQLLYGFECGADDYVTKPFRQAELISRIKALLRRANLYNPNQLLISGDLRLDLMNHKLYKAEKNIELTALRFEILRLLMECAPLILTRDALYRKVWECHGQFIEENTLNVHLSALRKAIGNFEGQPYFLTLYGIGYRWQLEVSRKML